MSKVIDVTMKFKKSTPNKHVFEEVEGETLEKVGLSAIPSLYICKAALTEPAQVIRVTVEILK